MSFVLQHSFLIRDEQGNPAHIAGVLTDITERKQTEDALRQSRDELQMVYNEMLEGCVITDIESKRFVRVNRRMCQMLGYTEAELLSMSVRDIHREGEVAAALTRIQARAEGNFQEFRNVPISRKDGSEFYADILGNSLTYDGRPCVLGLFRDITERKQAEEALAESEQKYRTLVETSPDAVLMLDVRGYITFASRRLLELFGNERVEDFLGTSPLESIIQEDQQKFHTHFARTLQQGVVRNVEFTLFRRDGTRFPGEASAALVRDTSGKPTAIIVVLRDITEPKRAEGALRESEEKYKTLVETSPDAVVMSDLTGHITFASRRAAEMYGIEHVEEMLGRNPLEFIDAEAHERYRTNLQTFIEEGIRRDVEYKLVRKDGTRFPGELSGAVIRNVSGNPVAITAFIRDITDRKRAEEGLRQSRDELQAIYDSVVDGILVADAKTANPIQANAAFCRMLGYSEEEVYTISPEQVHSPEVLPRVIEDLETVRKGIVVGTNDLPFVRKDGRTVYADVVTTPIRYNERPAWISFFHDVTDRKHAQEALEREHRTLRACLQIDRKA